MNSGIGSQGKEFAEPGSAREEAEISFSPPIRQEQSAVSSVIIRHGAELTKIAGVHGISEGRTPTGDPTVRIDVDNDSVRARLPEMIEGFPVQIVVVPGGFEIFPV